MWLVPKTEAALLFTPPSLREATAALASELQVLATVDLSDETFAAILQDREAANEVWESMSAPFAGEHFEGSIFSLLGVWSETQQEEKESAHFLHMMVRVGFGKTESSVISKGTDEWAKLANRVATQVPALNWRCGLDLWF
jgi:type VI protein secretion system component VasF